MRILFALLLICFTSLGQVGHFTSDRLIPITKVSGFTTNDVYYGTSLIDYNLTGFSWWVVVDPVQNETTNNIQFLFGNLMWDLANQGWGFRSFQGTFRPLLDRDNIGSATPSQKTAQGAGTGYGELGYLQVLHAVIRNNVVYMYKNGEPIGYEGVNGPGLAKPSKVNPASTLGIGIGGFPGSPSQRKPFDGGVIAAGICSATGLTDAQVLAHYNAMLLDDPYATPTGVTNAWKAPDAGATWVDFVGGYVLTRFGSPAVTQTKEAFYPAYRVSGTFGDATPQFSQIPNTLGSLDIMSLGDSRSSACGAWRYACEIDKANKGMSNIRWVGRYPTPDNYCVSAVGYHERNNGMPGVSTRQCIDGASGFPPLASELVTYQPDVVVVWFGHNSGNTYSSMQGDILEVINTIVAYNSSVRILVLSEITGIREGVMPSTSGLSMSEKFHHYNNWLQGVVSKYRNQGIMISWVKVDLAIKWDNDADWLDTVHPLNPDLATNTTNGQVKIGEAVWPALRKLCGYQ